MGRAARYDPLGRRIAKQRLAADGETVLEQVDFTWDGTTLAEQTSHSPGSDPGDAMGYLAWRLRVDPVAIAAHASAPCTPVPFASTATATASGTIPATGGRAMPVA